MKLPQKTWSKDSREFKVFERCKAGLLKAYPLKAVEDVILLDRLYKTTSKRTCAYFAYRNTPSETEFNGYFCLSSNLADSEDLNLLSVMIHEFGHALVYIRGQKAGKSAHNGIFRRAVHELINIICTEEEKNYMHLFETDGPVDIPSNAMVVVENGTYGEIMTPKDYEEYHARNCFDDDSVLINIKDLLDKDYFNDVVENGYALVCLAALEAEQTYYLNTKWKPTKKEGPDTYKTKYHLFNKLF